MDLSRGQKLVVIAGLLALLAGIAVLSLGRLGARPAAVVYEAPVKAVAPTVQQLGVHVAGAVAHPGLYALRPGSRVNEAIVLAGGMLPEADQDSVNLAAVLKDGEQVKVLARVAPPPAAATPPPTPPAPPAAAPAPPAAVVVPVKTPVVTGPISLSQATKEQLEALPDIGPELAQRILYYRYEHGGIRSVEELATVQGIGKHRMETLRQYVRP